MRSVQFLFLTLILLVCSFAQAGNEGRGGIPEAITVDAFTKFITGDGLRLDVSTYWHQLKTEKIKDQVYAGVVQTLNRMKAGGMELDLKSPYVAGIENCRNAANSDSKTNPEYKNSAVRAWTSTGGKDSFNIKGKICFDIQGLVNDLTAQKATLVRAADVLTALAYHEHVHHFQYSSYDEKVIETEETEANAVGGYVLLYWRPLPVIGWSEKPYSETDEIPYLDALLTSPICDSSHTQKDYRYFINNPCHWQRRLWQLAEAKALFPKKGYGFKQIYGEENFEADYDALDYSGHLAATQILEVAPGTQQEAKAVCHDLPGYRLPSSEELKTLYDDGLFTIMPAPQTELFWTSSKNQAITSYDRYNSQGGEMTRTESFPEAYSNNNYTALLCVRALTE